MTVDLQMVRLRLAPSFLLEGIRSGSIALSVDVRRWALEE